MKPQYIFFALIFLFAGTSYAQETSQEDETTDINLRAVNFGAKAGLNFSNLYINNTSNSSKIGGHAGIYAEIPLTASFALQPELMFSQKGARYEFNNTKVDARLNYFDLPLLLEYKPAGNFSFQFGPQFSYLADAGLDCRKPITEGVDEEYKICDTYNFNSFDYGFAAGVEHHIFNGYQLGVRYSHGFMPLENSNDIVVNGHQPEKTGATNSLFQVSLMMPIH